MAIAVLPPSQLTRRARAAGAASVSVPSTTNVSLATLNYNAIVVGTYRIEWSCSFIRSAVTNSLVVEGLVDAAVVRSTSEELSDTTNTPHLLMVAYVDLTAGAHGLLFRARGETAITSTVFNPTITVERYL